MISFIYWLLILQFRMKITIGGTLGSGKSTVGRLLAKKLGCNYYYMGGIQREIAEEKKISLLELMKLEEEDPSIDMEVDQRAAEIGRKEDNFVLDGHLSFHFVNDSFKVFVDADFEERAKRILGDKIRKEHNVDLESTKDNMKVREKSAQSRWLRYYNIDAYDKSQFDLVVDSTSKTPEELVSDIMNHLSKS